MPKIYLESDDFFKNMSSEELVKKLSILQQNISLYGSVQNRSREMVEQMYELEDMYTAELERRQEEGLIDEDKLDELFEDEDFV